MTRAFIALGSNLNNPRQQVADAVAAIAQLDDSELIACSPWYRSSAIGPGDQPDYINGVCAIDTALTPLALLDTLQNIENQHGRAREVRWGARTLDLDILLYGNYTANSVKLSLPHPRMLVRNFVLLPLADIAPRLILPNGITLASLIAGCGQDGIVKL